MCTQCSGRTIDFYSGYKDRELFFSACRASESQSPYLWSVKVEVTDFIKCRSILLAVILVSFSFSTFETKLINKIMVGPQS